MNRDISADMGTDLPLRLVQVSDTHLSARHAYFTDNYDAFVALMQADPPDLIVHTGDVSFNGPDAPGDLVFGRASLERLPVPWRAIAGNHDVGDAALGRTAKQPVTQERLAVWRARFGVSWWSQDFGAWRLIGLDTALMGSGLPQEAAQREFFVDALASRAARPVMVFIHMPPFLNDPDDANFTRGALNLAERTVFFSQCAAGGVRAVACGHLHIYRALQHGGMDIVWAPATSYVNMPAKVSAATIVPRAGVVEWTFSGPQVTHRLIEPPEMLTLDAHRWIIGRGSVTGLPERLLRPGPRPL